jgi:hypothetical protein
MLFGTYDANAASEFQKLDQMLMEESESFNTPIDVSDAARVLLRTSIDPKALAKEWIAANPSLIEAIAANQGELRDILEPLTAPPTTEAKPKIKWGMQTFLCGHLQLTVIILGGRFQICMGFPSFNFTKWEDELPALYMIRESGYGTIGNITANVGLLFFYAPPDEPMEGTYRGFSLSGALKWGGYYQSAKKDQYTTTEPDDRVPQMIGVGGSFGYAASGQWTGKPKKSWDFRLTRRGISVSPPTGIWVDRLN